MYEIFNNPLWWVIPAVILASFLVNHKVELPGRKKGDGSNTPPNDDKKSSPPSDSKPEG